ncbi:MAG: xylulokinase [Spirochaetaceae bacterium]|nr:MAG: xylulokinase [Spirochaetaceae bacterium]
MAGDGILACDLGTGGLKLALYSAEGRQLDQVFGAYQTVSAHETWAEQDAQDWWAVFCTMSRLLIERNGLKAGSIAAISFSGHMMACLPVDRSGNALTNCMIWADRRSNPQVEQLQQRINRQEFYRITGNRNYATYPLLKYMWLKQNNPAVYKRTWKFLQPKDYLVCRLTGVLATDYTDASGTAALDLAGRSWSAEILELSGIDSGLLPDIHDSSARIGAVHDAAAHQCGLAAGTPVVIGAGDGPCGNLGAGVLRQGKAYLYLGTSSWVSVASPQMLTDADMVLFNLCSVDPRTIYVYGTMQMGGGSFQWFKETFAVSEMQCAELTGENPYNYLTAQAAQSPPGARDLVFLPYLRGERSPHWNPRARGAFVGLTASHTRADIIRSVMEGVACNLKIIRDAIASEGAVVSEMRVIGGGAESALWRQIFADVFGETLHVPVLLEGANTLGAALLGGVGVGLFDSLERVEELNPVVSTQRPTADDATHAVYKRLYGLFNASYRALEPVFDQM